jgi:hypothetical protein
VSETSKATKRASRQGSAKVRPTPAAHGGVRQAVLDVVELHDGRWEGSAAVLAREAHPSNPASGAALIKMLMAAGLHLVAERKGRRITALVRAAGVGAPAARRLLAPVPDPAPAPSPPIRRSAP